MTHLLLAVLLSAPAHADDVALDDEARGMLDRACVPELVRRQESLAQLDLGDEARVAGLADEAWGHYRAALSLDPCNAFVWMQLGDMLFERERYDDAERALRKSLRLRPQSPRGWLLLGRTYEGLASWNEAKAAYQEALMVDPESWAAEAGLRRSIRRVHR
jgi:predicted Zn-dependent protease